MIAWQPPRQDSPMAAGPSTAQSRTPDGAAAHCCNRACPASSSRRRMTIHPHDPPLHHVLLRGTLSLRRGGRSCVEWRPATISYQIAPAALSTDRRGNASSARPALRQPRNDRVTPARCSGPYRVLPAVWTHRNDSAPDQMHELSVGHHPTGPRRLLEEQPVLSVGQLDRTIPSETRRLS